MNLIEKLIYDLESLEKKNEISINPNINQYTENEEPFKAKILNENEKS